MPLESLHSLVETLKERIQDHSDALSVNETLTRYALIDPLLRELGWDTADPSLVIPEYKSGKGRADYALLGSGGKPAMMIEAKSLGSSLRDAALTQGITYCIELGTKYFAITDGKRWEVYETYRAVPIDEKRVVEFDLSKQPAAEVCLQALALWRPSMELGRAVAGQATLIQPEARPSDTPESDPIAPEPASPVQDERAWQSLSELRPKQRTPSPVEIQFPDGSLRPIKHWNRVVVEVARWLVNSKYLRVDHCPIPQTNSRARYLVHKEHKHPTGKDFYNREQVETMWVEKDYIIPKLVENARTIINHVDQDTAQFKVRFD